jgi:hypothetical protein
MVCTLFLFSHFWRKNIWRAERSHVQRTMSRLREDKATQFLSNRTFSCTPTKKSSLKNGIAKSLISFKAMIVSQFKVNPKPFSEHFFYKRPAIK